VNLKWGPPFSAVNFCPPSSKSIVMTLPWTRPGFAVARDGPNFRVLKDGRIKPDCLLSLVIEP
jgi:hypothetical protein